MFAIGYIIVRDEVSVLEEVIEHHRREGLEIVVIDNGSTDGTLPLLDRLLEERRILAYDVHPTPTHAMRLMVAAAVVLAQRFSPEWIVHLDANTFLESASGRPRRLVDDIEAAQSDGYNVVSLRVYDFYPTPDDDSREPSVYRRVRHYTPRFKLAREQEKIFRSTPGLLVGNGHVVGFPVGVEKRISPVPGIMRHYVFRDRDQGVEKVLRRKIRWDEGARKAGSHIQYDGYLGDPVEVVVPDWRLHRKDEGAPWKTEMRHERPDPLLSERHGFNTSGSFDRQTRENTHLCCLIGCECSGTSLLLRTLASHPAVVAHEEPESRSLWSNRDLLNSKIEDGRARGKSLFAFAMPSLTESWDSRDRASTEPPPRGLPFPLEYEGQLLVFLVRDPRDVCLALRDRVDRPTGFDSSGQGPRIFDEFSAQTNSDPDSRGARALSLARQATDHEFAARAALHWTIKTEAYLRYDALGYKLRLVLYEDLVTLPDRTLRWLCRFLGVGFFPKLRKIDAAETRRFRGVMSIDEQRVILEIAGSTYRRVQRKWEQQLHADLKGYL
jgi:hypothetical protein